MGYWCPRRTRRGTATETVEQIAGGITVSKSNGVRRNQNPQAVSEVRRSQSGLSMCRSVGPGATASSASLSWSRMFHPLLPVGLMRTLQTCLDLDDNGDKVIFRQFGGESSLRTLTSGHTAMCADQFDSNGWQNNDQGIVTKYMSAIAHLHQRPRCTKRQYTSRRQ